MQKKSDHFDGKVFFNPTLPGLKPPGFREVLQMILTAKRSKWPKWVDSAAIPKLDHDLKNGEIALTFINHASFLIQIDGFNILTDPVWSKRVSPFQWIGPARARAPGLKLSELPPIDLILVSHNHYDHLDKTTLKFLAKKFSPITACAKGDGRLIRSLGFKEVHEMDWWESISIPAMRGVRRQTHSSAGEAREFADEKSRPYSSPRPVVITYTPTQHYSARGLTDRCRSLWGAFVIDADGRKTYFGGDAAYSTHFKETQKRLGPMDVALLGIGAYKPKWFMTSMHMDPEDAVMAHLELASKQSVGMHFGTFQLSSEAIDQPLEDLRIAKEKHGVSEQHFLTLSEGETRCF